MNKTVIVIAGPTASGKTSLAVELAKRFDTAIISADSRQCFKEMNIGVAKPSDEELSEVKHYFINSHSIHDEVNAMVFEQYALQAAEQLFQNNDIVIMAGGTGLYIKAFCEGLDEMPVVSSLIREEIIQNYQQKGIDWLRDEVQRTDPLYYESGEIHNPQRLMRALEIKLATGESIRNLQKQKKTERDFSIIKYGIEVPRERLYDQINARVDAMVESGLIEEVQSLLKEENRNALQTVGYSEIFAYLHAQISLPEAIERIKINTRHYAKRQLTWFRKDTSIHWINADTLTDRVHQIINTAEFPSV